MIVTDTDHMLMKLTDPDEYNACIAEYKYDRWAFEGFFEDIGNFPHDYFPPNTFHNDRRFWAIHSCYSPINTFDYRASDKNQVQSLPWVMFIIGKDDNIIGFKRFKNKKLMKKYLKKVEAGIMTLPKLDWVF